MNRRAIFSIAPLLAVLASAAAFSVQPLNAARRTGQLQLPVLFAAEDGVDSAVAVSEESEGSSDAAEEPPKPAVKCPDCDLCDGSGRILGGIGTVLDWWPIKAYRPCPNFVERGGRYVRSGQGLDEIAFGRDSTFQGDN